MSNINPHAIYALPETEFVHSGDKISSEEQINLLNAIGNYMNEAEQKAFSADIERHIGESSVYALKNEVCQALKVIHDRFMAENNKPSEKTIIALKLQERAEKCTPGFHNGVNEILDGFFLAKSLNDLMYRFRRDIVARTASTISDDDHVNNRCFSVAEEEGYGVHPLNRSDQHLNHMFEEIPNTEIRAKLKEAFDRELRVFSTLQGLEDQLRGQLSQAGYTGPKEDAYPLDEYEAIENQLALLFQDTPVVKELLQTEEILQEKLARAEQIRQEAHNNMQAFVEKNPKAFSGLNKRKKTKIQALLGETGLPKPDVEWAQNAEAELSEEAETVDEIKRNYKRATKALRIDAAREKHIAAFQAFKKLFFLTNTTGVTDLNWPNVRQLLWQGIKVKHYFEINPDEQQNIDTIMNPNASPSEVGMSTTALLKQENIYDLLNALFYLKQPAATIKQALGDFLAQLPENKQPASFKFLMTSALSHEIKQEMIQTYLNLFLISIKEDVNFLLRGAPLMRGLQLLNDSQSEMLKTALTQTNQAGDNALILAVLDKPEAIPHLTDAMLKLPENIKNKTIRTTFTQTSQTGLNVLILAVLDSPKAIPYLIDAMLRLPEAIKNETIKIIFTQTSEIGFNVLMEAVCKNPEAIPYLIDAMLRLPEAIKNKTIKTIFTQTNQDGENAIILAMLDNPEAIPYLIDAMLRLPEAIKNETIKTAFTQTNIYGENALMIAAWGKPEAIPRLTEALLKLPEGIKNETIKTVFTQTSQNSLNALMIAAWDKPEAIPHLTEAMLKLPEDIKNEIIKAVFIQTSQNNSLNALMIAVVLNKPEAIPHLTEAMLKLPEDIKNETIKTIFTHINSYKQNTRMRAIGKLDSETLGKLQDIQITLMEPLHKQQEEARENPFPALMP